MGKEQVWHLPPATAELTQGGKLLAQCVLDGNDWNAFNYAEPGSEGALLIKGSPFAELGAARCACEREVQASLAKLK